QVQGLDGSRIRESDRPRVKGGTKGRSCAIQRVEEKSICEDAHHGNLCRNAGHDCSSCQLAVNKDAGTKLQNCNGTRYCLKRVADYYCIITKVAGVDIGNR